MSGDVVVASNFEVLGVSENVLVDVHQEVVDLLLLVKVVQVGGLGAIVLALESARVAAAGSNCCDEQGENDAVTHHLRRRYLHDRSTS